MNIILFTQDFKDKTKLITDIIIKNEANNMTFESNKQGNNLILASNEHYSEIQQQDTFKQFQDAVSLSLYNELLYAAAHAQPNLLQRLDLRSQIDKIAQNARHASDEHTKMFKRICN